MEMGDSGQVRVRHRNPVGVHSRRKVEVRRWIYPDDAEVSGVIGSVLNSQRILNIPWINLVAQRSLLARGWEMLETPGFIDAVFQHVWAYGYFQTLRHRRPPNLVLPPFHL